MNDQLTLEIVKTRCTACGFVCHCLVPPATRALEGVLPPVVIRCHAPHGLFPCDGALRVQSARGVAHRVVRVGVGDRWNVAEPAPLELLGAKPGRVHIPRGDR